jgi:hypothetical protein
MKTILTKFMTLSGAALLMLSACKKDGALVTSNGGKPGTLSASATNLVLDKTKLTDPTAVVTFNISAANYGYSAAVTNTLQIDAANDNWAKPTSVTLANKVLTQGYSTADFNNLLLKLNLPAGTATQVQVRVMHSISAGVAPIYSNVVSLTATPFNLTSYLYVPGAYEGSSWPNPGPLEDSLVSVTGNGVYIGIINFTAGNNQFLVTPKKNWDHKYATNDGSNTTGSYSVTYDGANNFYAPPTAGWYLITLNINNNTMTIVPANYYSVIGSVTAGGDWSTDADLKFINSADLDWEGNIAMTAGEFKVRQNHDWGNSWGIPKPGSAGDGVAAALNNTSNNNIQAPTAGTHKVTFSIPITPVGTAPSTLASYTFQ